jgi:hypothetical protein
MRKQTKPDLFHRDRYNIAWFDEWQTEEAFVQMFVFIRKQDRSPFLSHTEMYYAFSAASVTGLTMAA